MIKDTLVYNPLLIYGEYMKRNFLFIAFLMLIVLLSGCSRPTALTHFKKNDLFSKALQYTAKSDIVKNKEVLAMLNATYLNSTDASFNSQTEEIFIVGIYLPKYNDKNETTYLGSRYSLTLNKVEPESVEKLDKSHKMYGNLPLFNPWGKYYLVKFNKKKINEKYRENFTTYEKYNNLRYDSITLTLTDNIPTIIVKKIKEKDNTEITKEIKVFRAASVTFQKEL